MGDPLNGNVDSFRTVDGEVEEVNTPNGESARPIGGERARLAPFNGDGEDGAPTSDPAAVMGDESRRSRGRT